MRLVLSQKQSKTLPWYVQPDNCRPTTASSRLPNLLGRVGADASLLTHLSILDHVLG